MWNWSSPWTVVKLALSMPIVCSMTTHGGPSRVASNSTPPRTLAALAGVCAHVRVPACVHVRVRVHARVCMHPCAGAYGFLCHMHAHTEIYWLLWGQLGVTDDMEDCRPECAIWRCQRRCVLRSNQAVRTRARAAHAPTCPGRVHIFRV